MKIMKIICFISILSLTECATETEIADKKPHYTIILSPDLSNRIDENVHKNKVVHDVKLISNILENYFYKYHDDSFFCDADIFHADNRITNQRDKIVVRFPNSNNIKEYNVDMQKLHIDLSDHYFLQDPMRRIEYLQSIDTIKSFKKDTLQFAEELRRVYYNASKSTHGADIYSLLNNRLDNYIIKDTIQPYRNILILFTDGYVEAGTYQNFIKEGNKKTYLDQKTIDNFRRAFKESNKKNKGESLEAFFAKNNYGLIPLENNALLHLEVLAVEFYDRSQNKGGGQGVQPDDYEILKLFWEDWLKKSKVKRYEIHEYVDSVEEFETIWKKFIINNN